MIYQDSYGKSQFQQSDHRRDFRSETSDNMDSWKSRGGKSQGGEVKKWEDQRRERVGSKKMQVREKVGKSRFTVFFEWFGAPEGRKVTSLKRRVRSQLARWEMKNCTPLWREAHFQVKAHQRRTTFGSWDVEKVHAVVARTTFPSQKRKKLRGSDHFFTFRCIDKWIGRPIVHCLDDSRKSKRRDLEPASPFGSSIASLCHPSATTANYNSTALHYIYGCTTPHDIQQSWVTWRTSQPQQPLQPLQQTQLQPPFGQAVDSLCHPCLTTTNLSYRFPILKLPPPPCALLLVLSIIGLNGPWF